MEQQPELQPVVPPARSGFVGGQAFRGELDLDASGRGYTARGTAVGQAAVGILDAAGTQAAQARGLLDSRVKAAGVARARLAELQAELDGAHASVQRSVTELKGLEAAVDARTAELYRSAAGFSIAADVAQGSDGPMMTLARSNAYSRAVAELDARRVRKLRAKRSQASAQERRLADALTTAQLAANTADAGVVEVYLAARIAGADTQAADLLGLGVGGGGFAPSAPVGASTPGGAQPGTTGSTGPAGGEVLIPWAVFWGSDLYAGGPSGRGANGAGAVIALAASPAVAFPVAGQYSFIDSWGFPRSQTGWHEGADIMAPLGAPLVAVEEGTLTKVGAGGIGGNRLWLEGRSGNRYYYAHLDRYAPGMAEGRAVAAGEVLGYVGDTGNARGRPHLHFSVVAAGQTTWTNPYPMLAGTVIALLATAIPAPR